MRRPARRIFGRAELLVVVVAGCGDIYADPDEVVVTSARPGLDAGIGASPSPISVECPVDRPRENTPCFAVGSTCEYGKSADEKCNVILVCRGAPEDGYWDSMSDGDCHARSCPAAADIASLDGQPCTLQAPDGGSTNDADEAICNVGDGVCACTTGRGGADVHPRRWACVRPSSASCPSARPLAGQACSGTAFCDYGSCDFKRGALMECTNNRWLASGRACP